LAKYVRPKALEKGDVIGFVAPARLVEPVVGGSNPLGPATPPQSQEVVVFTHYRV